MFPPNIIPNKHTENFQSDERQPGKKLGIVLCNSPLNIKKYFFFWIIPNIFHLMQ